MMKKKLIIFFCALIISIAGCGGTDQIDEKEMNRLASSLTKLAKVVESTVRYKKPPEKISDSDLLKLACKRDPKLLEPFKKYTVKVHKENRHAIVLVCLPDGKRGLLEDAGCTAKMDKHLWKSTVACKFTLKVKDVCK